MSVNRVTPIGPASRRRLMPRLLNLLLIFASVAAATLGAEIVVRVADGVPVFSPSLGDAARSATTAAQRDAVPLAKGIASAWFSEDPPPLPNRRTPPADWERQYREIRDNPGAFGSFRTFDPFKAWNAVFAGDPCRHFHLRNAPGAIFVYDPPDGNASPPYRYLPDATTPLGLVTNQIGWRGPPIERPRRPRLVRIVFVGASTTVSGHRLPYSYPEHVGHWLNKWAAANRLDVRCETLNAGRESTTSADILSEVRSEVLPLRPDLVVYYEGSNQFDLRSIAEGLPTGTAPRGASTPDATPPWLRAASDHSALARRLQAAFGYAAAPPPSKEWPKPDYRLMWPEGLNEADPDIAFPRLPVNLNAIQRDLDGMRAELAAAGSEFALSSFVWLVKDGMVLDPIRNRYILEHLNVTYYPFRYRDLERLAAFQNRVFAKYAAVRGIPFIDVARYMPLDTDLFIDGIHDTAGGVRLRAWIVLQQLIPIIEKRLSDGQWPRTLTGPDPPLPTFVPRRLSFDCKAPPK